MWIDVWSDTREEGRRYRYCHHCHERLVHLVSLLSSSKPLLFRIISKARANSEIFRTPYLWPKSDEPKYIIALSSSAAFSVATALLAWLAKILFVRKNKQLKERDSENMTFYVY